MYPPSGCTVKLPFLVYVHVLPIPSSGVGLYRWGYIWGAVKRGEGDTHGYKTETARNVQHMQQRVEHIHAEGGVCRAAHTYLGGNGTYVLTTLPPVLPV